jgi:hypothetical protein
MLNISYNNILLEVKRNEEMPGGIVLEIFAINSSEITPGSAWHFRNQSNCRCTTIYSPKSFFNAGYKAYFNASHLINSSLRIE